ncbi:MAG TPA: type 4a pilus biogenesis protein PilO [Candidatus Saccharimonadia bacterium]
MNPKTFFFMLIGVLAVTLAAGGGGYYYALKRLNTQSTELATKLAATKAATDQIDTLNRTKLQYQKTIVPILSAIDEALPHDKKQTEILAQLQSIAGSEGLAISSVSMPSAAGVPSLTSQTIKTGAVLALPINFQLSGSYAQLQNFLMRVESLNRFTNVTNLAISRPDKNKPIVYSISLNAYIKP